MLWYLLDRYIHCLYGKTHLDLPEDEKRRLKLEKGENIDPNREFLKMAGLSVDADQMKASMSSSGNGRSHVHLLESELVSCMKDLSSDNFCPQEDACEYQLQSEVIQSL